MAAGRRTRWERGGAERGTVWREGEQRAGAGQEENEGRDQNCDGREERASGGGKK